MIRLLAGLFYYGFCYPPVVEEDEDARVSRNIVARVVLIQDSSPTRQADETSNEIQEYCEETCDRQQLQVRNPQEEQNIEHCSSRLSEPPSLPLPPYLLAMAQAEWQSLVDEDVGNAPENAYKLRGKSVLSRKQGRTKLGERERHSSA